MARSISVSEDFEKYLNPPGREKHPDDEGEGRVIDEILSFDRVDLAKFYSLAEILHDFRRVLDEKLAAALFFKGYRSFTKEIVRIGEESGWDDDHGPEHIWEIVDRSGRFNADREIKKIKKLFSGFGVRTISGDELWEICQWYEEDCGMNERWPQSGNNYSKFWLLFELRKMVFEDELVFKLKKDENFDDLDQSSGILLDAILMRHYADGIDNRDKSFITLVDRVEWPEDMVYSGLSRNRDTDIVAAGDEELFMMCLEKNIIPRENIPVVTEMILAEGSRLMPILILANFGYMEKKQ